MQQNQQFEEPEETKIQLCREEPIIGGSRGISGSEFDIHVTTAHHEHLGSVVKRDRNRRALITGILPFLPFAVLGVIEQLLSADNWISLCNNPGFVVTAVVACVAGPIWALKPSKRAREATGELAQIADVSAIGSMVDALYFGTDPGTGEDVRVALTRLLPLLKASDAHLLSDRQMHLLQLLLMTSAYTRGDLLDNPIKKLQKHARLQIAILKAFEQIGDGRVISGVRYAQAHGASREVKLSAAECMPFVQERVDLAKASKTLLRPSGVEAADSSILVRPTDAMNQNTPHEEMLRPSLLPVPDN
jgi:hypothetical protein